MRKTSNLPPGQLESIPGEAAKEIITNLRQLYDMGKPQTDQEVADRLDQYFMFCQEHSFRPGVETLALSLHISRQTLFNWSRGIKCSPQRQQLIEAAKGFVAGFIEQAALSGRLNPATFIFLAKNWMAYKDNYSLEASNDNTDYTPNISTEEILRLRQERRALPEKPDLDDDPAE